MQWSSVAAVMIGSEYVRPTIPPRGASVRHRTAGPFALLQAADAVRTAPAQIKTFIGRVHDDASQLGGCSPLFTSISKEAL